MTEPHAINTELYHRTNRLFDNKRNSLPPERIEGLAIEVIQRLVRLGPPVIKVDCSTLAAETVSEFCDLLLKPDPAAPLSFILKLQRSGMSLQSLRFGLIAQAARFLGERWERNEIPFIEVTAATGQLYALIRAIKTDRDEAGWARRTRRNALFAAVPGETHTIGISLAAETFRDAGWDIDLRISDNHDDLISHVISSQPMVIGVSLSTKERLPDLIRLVLALRIAVPEATIGVAPALDMDDVEIHDLVDVDLIFRDARLAVNALERLLLLR